MTNNQKLYYWINALELNVKRAIRDGFLNGWNQYQVILVTNQIIEDGIKKIPSFLLQEQEFYKRSLVASRNRWLAVVFNKTLQLQLAALVVFYTYAMNNQQKSIAKNYIDLTKRNPNRSEPTPFEIQKEIQKEEKTLFRKSKGQQYLHNLRQKMKELAKNPVTEEQFKKRKLSLFTKAELRLRYEEALQEIESFKENDIRYAYISSHADCSERCYPYQGKLVSLFDASINSKFETGEVIDGRKVYSLTDITAQTDRYGYHNTVIVGFNCRHYLIPYTLNRKPPKIYPKRFVKRKEKASAKMRQMERDIKRKRMERLIVNPIDKDLSRQLKEQIEQEITAYHRFAQKKNIKPLDYRFAISKTERKLLLKED